MLFPTRGLKTPLCNVRRWAESDIRALPALANDARVAEYMTLRFPSPYSDDDAAAWVALQRVREEPTHFAIDVEGVLAGGISLEPGADIHRGSAEVGYWLGSSFWGRGVATAALRALTEHTLATSSLHRLWAGVMKPNARSARVLERAGYRREAVLESAATTRSGIVVDEVVYARLRPAARPP
ncbi:MAG: GNAT family N-acetyltransferase [Vulcanimicrobiaceae bacterium]